MSDEGPTNEAPEDTLPEDTGQPENEYNDLAAQPEIEEPAPVTEADPDSRAEIGQSERRSFFTVGRKIGGVVGIGLFFLCAVSGTAIYQMEQIALELEAIAERDTPMVEMFSKITTHQLEQSINAERSFRYGEEMLTLPETKPHFDKSVATFEKYSKLVNKEVIQGEEMAAKFIELSGTKEDKDEFKHILEALKKFEKQHLVFEDHFREFLVLVKVGNLVEARKMF